MTVRRTGEGGGADWAALDGRGNALNFIRLVLASLVIVGHAYLLAYGQQPPIPVHAFAVDGFFIVSGFLIAGARQRADAQAFLRNRTLRLVPGLVACLVVSAAVIAPYIALKSTMTWTLGDAVSYVWRNGTFQMSTDEPMLPFLWNGSLWTLPFEFGCYLALSMLFGVARHRRTATAIALAACSAVTLATLVVAGVPWVIISAARVGGFFAAGALFYLWRKRIPSSPLIALLAASCVTVLAAVDVRAYQALGSVPLTYVLLWIGASLPIHIARRNDISYGVYIYGFPVQQFLTLANLGSMVGPVAFSAVSLLLTLPFALASWLLVERPAMRLKRVPAMETIRLKWWNWNAETEAGPRG